MKHYKKPFVGTQDNAQFVWSNKTHRTSSEAFRDADYATPLWRCETETDRAIRFFKDFIIGSAVFAFGGVMIYSFMKWIGLM